MIKIARTNEPEGLPLRRGAQLQGLGASRPHRTAAHDNAYRTVKGDLVAMQRHKCCYCERRTVPDYNDVEHYRPFALYWWLAWTWENLLFACAACNRKGGKLDQFPLVDGSSRLVFPQQPPSAEQPLLLDPTVDDPREHIRFARLPDGRWAPIGASERGRATVSVLDLSRDSYLDCLTHHVDGVVAPVIHDLREANKIMAHDDFGRYWRRKCEQLLDPDRAFRALSEDVLRHEFPTFPAPPGPGPSAPGRDVLGLDDDAIR